MKMSVEDFKVKFPAFSKKLDSEATKISSIKLSAPFESEVIGIWTQGAAPWDLDPELRTIMEGDKVLALGLANRPLQLQLLPNVIINESDSSINRCEYALGSMDFGRLFVNNDIEFHNSNASQYAANTSRTWGAEFVGDFEKMVLADPSGLVFKAGGDSVSSLTAQQQSHDYFRIFDVSELDGINEFIDKYGLMMGVRARHRRLNADGTTSLGKVFLMTASYSMSGNVPSTTSSDENYGYDRSVLYDKVFVESNHANAFIAGDASFVSQWFPSIYYPTSKQSTKDLTNLFKIVGLQLPASASPHADACLVVEIPLTPSPGTYNGVITSDYFSGGQVMPTNRYFITKAGEYAGQLTPFSPNLAKIVYGDRSVMFKGQTRKIWDFPITNHGSIEGMSLKFHPLIGLPPKEHNLFLGNCAPQDGKVSDFDIECALFQIERDWIEEYQLTAHGSNLKPLAASRVKDEWSESLPPYVNIAFYNTTFTVTSEDVLSTNIARRYKKAREKACKTDNFMSLEYASGVTYRDCVNSMSHNGLSVLSCYSDLALKAHAQRSQRETVVSVVVNYPNYSCVVGSAPAVNIPVYSSDATSEMLNEALEYVSSAILSGGKFPNDWKKTLKVSEEVTLELEELMRDVSIDGAVTLVTSPSYLTGSSTAHHNLEAIKVSGFLVPHLMQKDARVDTLLYNSLPGMRKLNTSLKSIINQFSNSNYSVGVKRLAN